MLARKPLIHECQERMHRLCNETRKVSDQFNADTLSHLCKVTNAYFSEFLCGLRIGVQQLSERTRWLLPHESIEDLRQHRLHWVILGRDRLSYHANKIWCRTSGVFQLFKELGPRLTMTVK